MAIRGGRKIELKPSPDVHRVRDGPLEWEAFGRRMTRLRREVRQALEEGSRCGCAKTSATCFEILKVEEGLWTFARVKGIEPTNNAAERALRFAVIWRRISGGTDSQRGSRFVERTLSVVATCRQQGRNVLEYLTSCFEADHRGQPIPSLLPQPADSESRLISPIPTCERLPRSVSGSIDMDKAQYCESPLRGPGHAINLQAWELGPDSLLSKVLNITLADRKARE